MDRKEIAIVIGGSSGGLEALMTILSALPPSFVPPIVVVLHIPADRPSLLVDVLRGRSARPVEEVDDKQPIEKGVTYVAPADYHLLVETRERFSLSVDAPVQFSRPSIDVLFESAADAFGPALVAVLLSGANDDGAVGLGRVKKRAGTTIVQSPETAQVATMPKAAIRLGHADHILPLDQIAPFLAKLDPAPTDAP
jgi:two-component system, chemotaxis family, protein-glutamate methylesterase/glutaminase